MLPVAQEIAARARNVELTSAETTRYSRHLLLPEVGVEGQRRLKAARVLLIGTGGLGSPVSLYLAAAGVGTIGLVEFDDVDTTNLQRQVLYGERHAGKPKLDAAIERLKDLNSALKIVPHRYRLDETNIEATIKDYDVVVDGTDNFSTRYLVNDACVLLGKPNVYGAIFRFDGQASVFYAPHSPCYRCLFPAPPPAGQVPNCAEGGVLGILPAQIGSVQATETLKLLLGVGEPLVGRLLTLDALGMRFDEFKLKKDDHCPVCGKTPTIKTVKESAFACEVPAKAERAEALEEMTVDELGRWRKEGKDHVLIDVRTAEEAAICAIEGARLIPIATLEASLDRIPKDRPVVIHCKSGARSARAVGQLKALGYRNAKSLTGGILAWIKAKAPHLPSY